MILDDVPLAGRELINSYLQNDMVRDGLWKNARRWDILLPLPTPMSNSGACCNAARFTAGGQRSLCCGAITAGTSVKNAVAQTHAVAKATYSR